MEKIRRLKEWKNGHPQGPVVIELNPTNRCNLRCISCWQRAFPFDKKDELSKEKLLAIIDEAAELGIKEVRIPGAGEPLMRKDLFELMYRIKEKGMKGLLITNGTMFTEEAVSRLVEFGWDCITFSIDGPDGKTNDFLRGVDGSFKKTVAAIRAFVKLKEKKGKAEPVIRINTVLSNRNFNRLEEMANLLICLGCADWQIQALTVWGEDGESLVLSEEQKKEVQKHLKYAKKKMDDAKIFNNLACFMDDDLIDKSEGKMDERIKYKSSVSDDQFLSLPCFEPWYNMIILPDGTAAACSISGGVDGGDVKGASLKEVWEGEQFSGLRKRLLEKRLPDYCRKCCANVHLENEMIRRELLRG